MHQNVSNKTANITTVESILDYLTNSPWSCTHSALTLQKFLEMYYTYMLSIEYFSFDLYLQCTEYDFEHGTECLHLAQMYAEKSAALIDGPDSLWKVGLITPIRI